MAEQETCQVGNNVINMATRKPYTVTVDPLMKDAKAWGPEQALEEAIRLCQEEGYTKATILLHRFDGLPHKLSVGVTYTEEIANLEFWKQSLLADYEG